MQLRLARPNLLGSSGLLRQSVSHAGLVRIAPTRHHPVMKVFAVIILAVGMAALVDRQVNDFRYTSAIVKMAIEIKRNFLGR